MLARGSLMVSGTPFAAAHSCEQEQHVVESPGAVLHRVAKSESNREQHAIDLVGPLYGKGDGRVDEHTNSM